MQAHPFVPINDEDEIRIIQRFKSAFEKNVLGKGKFEFVEEDPKDSYAVEEPISSLKTDEIEEDKILNNKASPFCKSSKWPLDDPEKFSYGAPGASTNKSGEGFEERTQQELPWDHQRSQELKLERNLFQGEPEPVAEINQIAWMSFTKTRVAVKPHVRVEPSQDPKPSSWLKGRMMDPVTGAPTKRSNMTVDAETAEIILTNFNKMPGDDNKLSASRGHR